MLETLSMLVGRGVHLGTLPAVLARRYGDRWALNASIPVPGFGDRLRWTFEDVEDAVGRLAAALQARGVAEGEVVLTAGPNRLDGLLLPFAAARLGAVACPVNPRLKRAELEAVARAAGAVHAVVDPEAFDRWTAETPWLDAVSAIPVGEDGLAASLSDARVTPRSRSLDDVVVALCTSGTTGVPKAAALTSRGLLSSAGRFRLPFGRRADGSARYRIFAALPLHHVMGLGVGVASLCAGGEWIFRERFDRDEALDILAAGDVQAFIGVPTMYADMEAAGAEHRNLGGVRVWFSAADAMPPERARRFQRFGAVTTFGRRRIGTAAFFDVYGMVELSGAAAVRVYPFSVAARLTAPAPAVVLPGIRVRAVDETGSPVAFGRIGELQFQGPSVLREYRGRPDAGPGLDGWFSTGDYGRVLPGGAFLFAGRKKDRLKVGGFSVFPPEVETILEAHPEVAEVALVGVPDERLGERPVAVVVPREPTFPDAAFLAWAQERVAGYRRPRAVVVVEALPRGANGKIDRAAATRMARR